MESNILLESGTNELEVLEFMVGEQSFGINIAKVTEIDHVHHNYRSQHSYDSDNDRKLDKREALFVL